MEDMKMQSLQDQLKQKVGQAALEYVMEGEYLGVGTGSTVRYFIDALAESGIQLKGCVSSSEASTRQLIELGLKVCDLSEVKEDIPVYIDGCDEIDANFCMIKGGGGALTREKILAQASKKFVCIADKSKKVAQLGVFPLPIEVIPMAVSRVARVLETMGGKPVLRNFVTDNGNNILDIHGLKLSEPRKFEEEVNQIPGVVTCGIFARRGADVLLVGTENGVEKLLPDN